MPDVLATTAAIERDGHSLVMAARHRTAPMVGVQFHPESILTPEGGRIIDNAMQWARDANR
jgi:anthranilate synthase component 2